MKKKTFFFLFMFYFSSYKKVAKILGLSLENHLFAAFSETINTHYQKKNLKSVFTKWNFSFILCLSRSCSVKILQSPISSSISDTLHFEK